MHVLVMAGVFACLVLLSTQGSARDDPAAICDAAARQVSAEIGVPPDVLRAITRTETGRGQTGALRPWPWTVNMKGKGIWFDTEQEARAYVFRHFKSGARSFDVGCFQINYRWHGQAFQSIEEMFDPLLNARYAAQFLAGLHAELGSWTAAAGAYHSRTEKHATHYKERYRAIHAALDDKPDPAAPRANGFTLLTGRGAPPTRGSLVPLHSSARSLFPQRAGE